MVSLQESLESSKEDSALTLEDVLQDSFSMEDGFERQDDARHLRQLIESLPAREAQTFAPALRPGWTAASDTVRDRKADGHQPQLCIAPCLT